MAESRPANRRVSERALQARYEQGLALHGRGELDAAEALYRGILGQMPESFHALHMLGVLVGQRGDLEGSARLLADAVRADPTSAVAHANLGHTQRLLERHDEAMASFDRALRLQPGQARALKGRGLLLWKGRRFEESLACYEHLLGIEPGYADGWIMKAAALGELGRSDEAVACYRRALEFDDVANPDKIRYVLASLGGGAVPAASPLEYVRDLFDKYARRFDDHLVGQLRYRGPELLAEQLRPLLPPAPIDIVDLGCGTGLFGPLLRPWARSLCGVDLSRKMLDEAARKGLYDELVEAEMVAFLAAAPGRFDLVAASDVFIYLGDLAPAFAAAFAALRPGGLFAFSTEASDGDADSRLDDSMRYAHSRAYLERLAVATGFAVEAMVERELREENRLAVVAHLAVLRRP